MFSDPTRATTLLLTALMVIGLGFFIRASTKDRIEVAQFGSTEAAEPLQKAVTQYFQSRAYRPVIEAPSADASPADTAAATAAARDAQRSTAATVTVSGLVSPSVFMAIFLSLLAAVGLACLALILVTLWPSAGAVLFGLVALSPLAGIFYWRKSSRPETVVFKVEDESTDVFAARLTVKGHRDEIAELQTAFDPILKAWQA